MPAGRGEVVVIVGAGGTIVIPNVPFAVSEAPSVTVAVKLKLPAVEGVPEIDPSEPRESPAGADPDHR